MFKKPRIVDQLRAFFSGFQCLSVFPVLVNNADIQLFLVGCHCHPDKNRTAVAARKKVRLSLKGYVYIRKAILKFGVIRRPEVQHFNGFFLA